MKKRGFGLGKYNGVGGKVEEGESVEEAVAREIKEEIEVSVKISDLVKIAEINFQFDQKPDWNQVCHVFLTQKWVDEPRETEEMKPEWFEIEKIPFKKMWIDDPHWLPLVLSGKRIKAEFVFGDNGEKIISEKVEII